jgi:hypothetical protein
MSRTIRKPYTGSKRFDRTCRNHGGCPWCERNRTIQRIRAEEEACGGFKKFMDLVEAEIFRGIP